MEKASSLKGSAGMVLAAMACLVSVMFWNLGGLPLIGPDEPRYAAVARAMFASGDYIATRLGDNLWFEKPVLFYWLAAVS
ncbi:MAG: hypothetical protein JWN98_1791, partial [Abditibacteriota bacterium]|nr:hypothetical protein [Abditibacteriota bacterium]